MVLESHTPLVVVLAFNEICERLLKVGMSDEYQDMYYMKCYNFCQ